jgi:quercetin dioxygenase-like cupin family protein
MAQAFRTTGLLLALLLTACSATPGKPFALVDFPGPADQLTGTTLLKMEFRGRPTLEIGYASVEKGTRVPAQGSASLPVHDIGIMLEGKQIDQIDRESVEIRARQLLHVDPNVPQSTLVTDALRVVFLFVGEPVDEPGVPKPPASVENNPPVMIWASQDLAAPSATFPVLKVNAPENPILEIGVAQVPAGTTMPATGSAAIPAYDVEIILKGRVEATLDGQVVTLQAGDILRLPPEVQQTARFLEDTELVYIFYGGAVTIPGHSGP